MRVLHSGTLDANAGGPAMSTYYTLYGLRSLGVEAEIFMYPLSQGGVLRGQEVPVHYTSAPWEKKFAYSPVYKKDMRALGMFDLYHAQGIWQYPTYAIVDVARECRKPYLITPRGMLYPQDIRKSNETFKRLSLKFRLLRDFNRAACVHVTCREEMEHCRRLGVMAPMAVIPNPVEVKEYPGQKTDAVFRLGYLGRLSPRKNVEGLIYAFHALGEEIRDAELLIIGGGDVLYERFLRNEVKRLALEGHVRFAGFLSGAEKDRVLSSLSVLAMPSEFENFGNVILEGLIRGIPCLATTGSPWEELQTYGCGWWVPYSQQDITAAVSAALHTSAAQLKQMGERGRRLVEERYSVEAVARQMKTLYEWVMGAGEKPEFVYE